MKYRKFNKVEPESIGEVRETVLKEYKENPELFCENDIEQLSSSDWMIFRFLEPMKGDKEKATINLIDSLKWRKSKDFSSFGENFSIPETFLKMGIAFNYESDKWGQKSLYLRIKYVYKINEIRPVFRRVLEFLCWKIDDIARESNWVLILDFKDSGLANADLEILRDLISTLKTHFPCGLDYILITDLPWILKSFWQLARVWLSSSDSLIRFVSRKEITDYFEPSNLPDFMGGQCDKPYCGDAILQSLGLKTINRTDLFTYCHEYLKLSKEKSSEIVNTYHPIIQSNCI